MSARFATFTLMACALAACGKAEPSPGRTSTTPEQEPVPAEVTTQAAPHDLGAGAKPPPRRGVSRMRIDTVQAAMTRVAGNDVNGNPIRWMYNNNDGFSDAAFGKALGRPDFLTSTDESTVPNALYLKFVGDAARDICMQMARNDQKRSDAATRVLFPKAPVDGTATDAQVNANLQYLILRFLGFRLPDGDPMIAGLRKVHDTGVASVATPGGPELTPAAEGWRGVCVTLFESPLFHND